jgi:hypothetical protein
VLGSVLGKIKGYDMRAKDLLKEGLSQPNLEYKGFKYETEKLEDEDTRKILHYVVSPSGKRADIDWNPWSYMTQEEFEMWLRAGMPSRKDVGSIGPLYRKDLDKLTAMKEASGQDSFNRGGFNPLRDQRDYLDKRNDLWKLYNDKNLDPESKAEAKQRLLDLDKQARAKGWILSEEGIQTFDHLTNKRLRRILVSGAKNPQEVAWAMDFTYDALMADYDDEMIPSSVYDARNKAYNQAEASFDEGQGDLDATLAHLKQFWRV